MTPDFIVQTFVQALGFGLALGLIAVLGKARQ